MRASTSRIEGFRNSVTIRGHELTVDEEAEDGGTDAGPTPLELLAGSLAGCVAITMEMYAGRKGWDVAGVGVDVEFSPAERGTPTRFEIVLRLPEHLTDEQADRLAVIAAKCPVHRVLDGEVMFDERVERATLAG
jgi:putative redox protein